MPDVPSERLQPTPSPALRASDADRERATQALADHCAAGRLTLDELTERVEAAVAARTVRELDALLADLPGDAAPAQPAPMAPARAGVTPAGASRTTIAVMSGASKKGRWRAAGRHVAVAVMGGLELDLRSAEIVGHQLEIVAVAFWGGIDITLPEGIAVEVEAVPILGGVDTKLAETPPLPDTPLVRIHAIAVMGAVNVRTKRRREGTAIAPPPAPPPPPSLPR